MDEASIRSRKDKPYAARMVWVILLILLGDTGICHSRDFLPAWLGASGTNGYVYAYREDNVSEDNRQRNYRRWEGLPPEEKDQLRNRMNQYKQLTPEDRQQYRQKYEQWKNLPPEDRRQVQQSIKGWNDLSPEEKEAVRRRLRDQ